MVTLERLKELLDYDETTGVFTRKIRTSNRVHVGDIAGNFDIDSGYRTIWIDGRSYYEHRLAWFYVHGVWPRDRLDHRNTIRSNNWIDNLREVNNSENMMNQKVAPKHNKSTGVLGVSFNKKTGKYEASIKVNGKKKHLGLFTTIEEAYEKYVTSKRNLHSTCTI